MKLISSYEARQHDDLIVHESTLNFKKSDTGSDDSFSKLPQPGMDPQRAQRISYGYFMKDVFDGESTILKEKKVPSDQLDQVRLKNKFDDYLEFYKDTNEFVDKAKFMPATMSTRFEDSLKTKFGIDSNDLNVSVHQLQQD